MSNQPKLHFDPLSRHNYHQWYAHVRDYLNDNDLDDVYDAVQAPEYEGKFAEDLDDDEYDKKEAFRKSWAYVCRHLDSEMFNKTTDESDVPYGDTVALLRYLRYTCLAANTPDDRHMLREKFEALKLEDFNDMDEYIIEFKRQRANLAEYKKKLWEDDEDALYRFHKSLPRAYSTHETIVTGRSLTLEEALHYYSSAVRMSHVKGDASLALRYEHPM